MSVSEMEGGIISIFVSIIGHGGGGTGCSHISIFVSTTGGLMKAAEELEEFHFCLFSIVNIKESNKDKSIIPESNFWENGFSRFWKKICCKNILSNYSRELTILPGYLIHPNYVYLLFRKRNILYTPMHWSQSVITYFLDP